MAFRGFLHALTSKLENDLKNYLVNNPHFQHFAVTSSKKVRSFVNETAEKAAKPFKEKAPSLKKEADRVANAAKDQPELKKAAEQALRNAIRWFNRQRR